MIPKTIVAGLLAILATIQADPSPNSATFQKTITVKDKTYDIVDMQWDLRINKTHTMTVTGSIEDGLARLAEINPTAAASIHAAALQAAGARKPNNSSIDRRDMYTPIGNYCNIFTDAGCSAIENGISYLRGLDGAPAMPPGPGVCGQVSCSYNSAIWWCNDNNHTIQLQSFSRIADGAENIMELCVFDQTPGSCSGSFSGQQFFEGGFNVIVKGGENC